MVILFLSPLTKFENELTYSYCKIIWILRILRAWILHVILFFCSITLNLWSHLLFNCNYISLELQRELCTNLDSFSLPFSANIFIWCLFFSFSSHCICSSFLIVQRMQGHKNDSHSAWDTAKPGHTQCNWSLARKGIFPSRLEETELFDSHLG